MLLLEHLNCPPAPRPTLTPKDTPFQPGSLPDPVNLLIFTPPPAITLTSADPVAEVFILSDFNSVFIFSSRYPAEHLE